MKALRWVVAASGLCAAVVAGIGFAGSYAALRDLAMDHGFGTFSYVFPIGIDAGIGAMYGLDLVLVWRRMPKPVLRLVAHILTLATIAFNAASGEGPVKDDPLGAFIHGAFPLLFVAVVEALRHHVPQNVRSGRNRLPSRRRPRHAPRKTAWPGPERWTKPRRGKRRHRPPRQNGRNLSRGRRRPTGEPHSPGQSSPRRKLTTPPA
ncbi:DUF2637 domain-containing protein [Streptomyces sp. NPDC052095]|uniref:DUF2637 domain-containing protein n=1 Tax=unclassified Streptomyces TaxID=2593676 RepID=UPI00344D6164